MEPGKRIKISSSSSINSDSFFQKITDHNTGKTKIINKPQPHQFNNKTNITGNLSEPEKLQGTIEKTSGPQVTRSKPTITVEPVEGHDISQL